MPTARRTHGFRFGIPDHLEFLGDCEAARLFDHAIMRLEALGGTAVTIAFAPFAEVGHLLYGGPWVAERLAAIETFIAAAGAAMHPVTRQIIGRGALYSAVDTFRAFYRLESLRAHTQAVWERIDCLVVPTAPTIYRIDAVEAEPLQLNSHLGLYTTFVNLLDLAAVAVPCGFRPHGLPVGITLIAPALHEAQLVELAGTFHRQSGLRLGATDQVIEPDQVRRI
jgi:allophanate hydrolase